MVLSSEARLALPPQTSSTDERILLTALGVNPRATVYAIGAATARAEHAPLALLDLLDPDDIPSRLVALLTPLAKEQVWNSFRSACTARGVECSALDIPDGTTTADITATLHRIAAAVPQGCKLVLDLTHGYRHLPFLFYPLCLYLSAFRGVRIVSAWYGRLEGGEPGTPKPLIRLDPLLQLPEWLYAVRVFVDTGNPAPLAGRFTALRDSLPKGPERGPSRSAAEALIGVSHAYELGLPLELGLKAGKLSYALAQQPLGQMQGLDLPLAAELQGDLLKAIESFRFPGNNGLGIGQASGKWKRTAVLDRPELLRQAELVDLYLARNQFGQALGLMREWVVSLGVLHRGTSQRWLDRAERVRVERELGSLVRLRAQKVALSDDHGFWATFWDLLGQTRNALAHAGMREDAVALGEAELRDIRDGWAKVKAAERAWESLGGGGGALLVSPLGRSPGVLYSAILAANPAVLLVVCSADTKDHAALGIERAGFTGAVAYVQMMDPLCGFDEMNALGTQVRPTLLAADEVVVNLTGGTTLMGIIVQRMFELARELQRPSRRLLLTDSRSPGEQMQNPWLASPWRWLDAHHSGESE